ncbi:ATP-binding protein [Streptomyces sp. NWU339]|uniref:ATP-binding protein n=1 Tax=Streptomyces sp. NWU339 TaxID=2185284 RepID=UPI000D67E3D8|nr:ATP-binding protein [Streptomyces sp. NWU339]PWI12064.1 ATP-binding protein [Streptomyces sp. NWU339]
MPGSRAPVSRTDRREGGRHGRPSSRPVPALPETQIRPQLLRLAVLPPVAVALSACAAVLFTVRSTGVRPGATLWAVLGGAGSVALAGIVIAAVAADRAARSVHERVESLRRSTARREADLGGLVDALRRGEGPPPRGQRDRTPEDADDFDLLAADLSRAHDGAVTAVVQASQLSSQAGSEQKLEVFVNLARRLQSLVHREISLLDEMENEIEDPDLLKGLFHVDHLATRIRRHAENLAVLGGAVSRRQWSNPVSMSEVLRSAIAEVEQYSRVKLVPPIDGTLRGHAVADVIHLLAELVENATLYSAPHTQVLLRAGLVTSGLAVEVEDRGLGMPMGEQERMNALLADPDQVNVAGLLADGRIGLFVVSQLAKRHGIQVRLQSNIYGGVQAVLVVPQSLLGAEPWVAGQGTGQPREIDAVPGAEHGGGPAPRPGRPVPAPGGVPLPGPAGYGTGPLPDPQAGSGPGPVQGPGTPRTPVPHAAGERSHRRDHATVPAPSPPDGVAPPLPLRGARGVRPNPAEATPGVNLDDRRTLAENGTGAALLTSRDGTVRGTMDKPRLPRRRAQEHLVPQLRDGPTPRQETEHVAGHDPHLMAAFQRGVSLAETQPPMDTGHMGRDDNAGEHMVGDPTVSVSMLPSRPMNAHPMDPLHTTQTRAMEPHSMESHTTESHTMEARHVPAVPRETRGAHDGVPAPRTDHTARDDGSAPAG